MNKKIEKIDFHDSNIVEIKRDGDEVRIKLDLCVWKQKIKITNAELKEIVIEFYSVKNYIWESDKLESEIDYDTILQFSYNSGNVEIVMTDGCTSVVKFNCGDYRIFF